MKKMLLGKNIFYAIIFSAVILITAVFNVQVFAGQSVSGSEEVRSCLDVLANTQKELIELRATIEVKTDCSVKDGRISQLEIEKFNLTTQNQKLQEENTQKDQQINALIAERDSYKKQAERIPKIYYPILIIWALLVLAIIGYLARGYIIRRRTRIIRRE